VSSLALCAAPKHELLRAVLKKKEASVLSSSSVCCACACTCNAVEQAGRHPCCWDACCVCASP
jgi:hypothetical protein